MDEQNSTASRRTRTWQMRYQTVSRKRDKGGALLEYLCVLFVYAFSVAILLPSCDMPKSVSYCRGITSYALSIPVSIFFHSVLFGVFGERMDGSAFLTLLIATWLAFGFVFQNIFVGINAMWYALGVFVFAPILLMLTVLIYITLKPPK